MKFSLALTAVLLPIFVNAQSSGSSSSSPSAPAPSASAGNNINVIVAPGDALTYSPSNFTAANGTTVTFVFADEPHSVTQSTFENPCTYLAAGNGSSAGFDSGLQTGKLFTIQITNDQEPIWFFCKEGKHCGLGMVGSINAPSSGDTADAFLAAAKAIGTNEAAVSDSGPVTGGVNAVATATPTASSASSASSGSSGSSSTPSPSSSKSSDAGHLVANGVFALLATTFGIVLA